MTVPLVKPPRTSAHDQRDALLQQFADAGLVPVISTNGGIPDADIQCATALLAEGGKHGELLDCWVTQRGQARLTHAHGAFPSSELAVDMPAEQARFRDRLATMIEDAIHTDSTHAIARSAEDSLP